jgi:murein DD-endopeptidase MepM/ murein hydrolase activator NlpD
MSSLHHARPVVEGQEIATTAVTETPAPARGTSPRRTGTAGGTNTSKVPTQRQGTASTTGTTSVGRARAAAKRPAATKAVTAAGSLAAKAKAATAAAAGSAAAKTAAGKAATARSAAAKAATAGATSARTAAARATSAAKKAAAAKPAAKRTGATAGKAAAAKAATPKAATPKAATPKAATPKAATPKAATPKADKPAIAMAETPKVAPQRTGGRHAAPDSDETPAAPALAAASRPRPTPYPRHAAPEDTAPEVAAPEIAVVVEAPAEALEPVMTVLADLQADPAEIAPGLPGAHRSWLTRRRLPAESRRPAFYLAAGLIGAMSIGMLVDTGSPVHTETATASHTVSVAEQLGIDSGQTSALADPESTRVLQELVVSRNQRDAAQVAAADAQTAADQLALVAIAEAARPKAVSPINGARLTSGFGARWGTLHAGIDLAAPMHTPEYAAMDGVVLEAGPASGFGLAVYIQHDNGDVTVYGHMDQILVQAGQVVRAGDTIALLGNRGQSTGPHLHFEVHKGGIDGTKVDPLPWLRERGVQI